MDKHEKHAYLEAIRKRYRRAKRADKGKILDEFCSVCGYQRKYAIRLVKAQGWSSAAPAWASFAIRPARVAGGVAQDMAGNRPDVQQTIGGCHAPLATALRGEFRRT